MSRNRFWDRAILHPFLLATYPVISLYANNLEETSLNEALRPLVLSLAGTAVLFLLLNLIYKELRWAGYLTTLSVGIFFTYGHIYNTLESITLLGERFGRHRYLIPIWVILWLLGYGWIYWKARKLQPLNSLLNLVAVTLLLFPFLQIGRDAIRFNQLEAKNISQNELSENLSLPQVQSPPDIYYIILDGYTRDDILKKNYQLDNSEFLTQLEEMGFYIARCSQSNYAQTQLSLASSLNYDYLEQLGKQFVAENTSRSGLPDSIQHSAVRNALEELGYQVIAFDSGYEATRLQDADLYLSSNIVQDINDFENLFLQTTLARVYSDGISVLNLSPNWEERDQAHRERIMFTLDTLNTIPDIPGPKFVFAHLITPHWPHVFGPNGEAVHEHPDSTNGYRNQVIFINKQIVPVLAEIIGKSNHPPIIILQADHGSIIESPKRRMSILNAYHLPDEGGQQLYENISPVNSFRVIFNHYFGGNLPLLADISYYSHYDQPYQYEIISDHRPGCTPP